MALGGLLVGALPFDADASDDRPIEQIVVIVEQNHTFDAYFTGYPGARSGSEDVVLDDGSGRGIARSDTPGDIEIEGGVEPLANGRSPAIDAYRGGAMDGFARAQAERGYSPELAMAFSSEEGRASLWAIADRFVLFDRYFSSYLGGSLANTMTLVTGETYGLTSASKANLHRLRTETIPTVFDSVSNAGMSARIYVGSLDQIDRQLVADGGYESDEVRTPSALYWMPPLAMPRFWDDDQTPAPIVDQAQFHIDAAEGDLPNVSYLLPSPTDHPLTDLRDAHGRLIALVNAVMKGPQWESTAVLIVWDDWGGFYDSVAPPIGLGFRVPALLLSPWAKEGYIATSTYDHSDVPRFISNALGLGDQQEVGQPFAEALDFGSSPTPPTLFDLAVLPPSPVGGSEQNRAAQVAYATSALVLAGVLATAWRLRRHLR
jgi:phospholipase C